MEAIWNAILFVFSTPDPSVFQADPVSVATLIVTTVASSYAVNRQMHGERVAERERNDQRADVQRREDQLTNEAKAKASATERMKTAGQRAGQGYGQNFFSSANSLGFMRAPARPSEDNIGRGTLFGN